VQKNILIKSSCSEKKKSLRENEKSTVSTNWDVKLRRQRESRNTSVIEISQLQIVAT
jgi:hypothetical protein